MEDKTMKKNYMTPATVTVNLKAKQAILTNSITINSSGDAVDAGGAASRHGNSSWDDEE